MVRISYDALTEGSRGQEEGEESSTHRKCYRRKRKKITERSWKSKAKRDCGTPNAGPEVDLGLMF
jgi:hypothetical protein